MAKQTALVLGATGGIGGEMARHLQAKGWEVRALHREAARVGRGQGTFDWRQGDALQAADVAATMMQLLARDAELDAFATFHMDGHWDADGTAMIDAIRRAVGRPDLPARRLPWWLIALASPVVPFCRELNEVRYFWQHPMRLDNSRLKRFLGQEPHTPLDEAVRETLKPLMQAAL